MSAVARSVSRVAVGHLLACVVVAAAVSGCGLGVRLPAAAAGSTTATGTGAEAVGHRARPPAPVKQVAAGARSGAQVVRRFAQAYINWDAADVASRLRVLARASVGQARSEMTLEAAETRADRRLQRGAIANHGVVEAVTGLAGSPGRYLVVTREQTTATGTAVYRGLPAAWHVTVATVDRVPSRSSGRSRWVVSGWQPES